MNDNLILKTNEQIKNQMYVWFLTYYSKTIEDFDGTELFTLFDKISTSKKDYYLDKINFQTNELPVFVLTVNNEEAILNTTQKFIRLTDNLIEIISYSDFEWHNGFKNLGFILNEKGEHTVSVKKNGYISEFGLRKTNGEIIYWNIPTGNAGFAFWNVTKKCELIGRKYKYV